MRSRELALPLDPEASEPLYRQLADGILEAIRQGRLKPGAPLPGTRDLAVRCGVNRNTVLAAFRELAAEGWIEGRPGSGSYVARQLPEAAPPGPAVAAPAEAGFDLRSHLELLSAGGPEGLDLREAWPDARLLPGDLLGEAYRTALSFRAPEVLVPAGAGEPTYLRALRSWLGERRGLWPGEQGLLATRGERGAVELALRGLVKGGGRVACLFPPLPDLAARIAGFGYHGAAVPRDAEGPDLGALENLEASVLLLPPRLGPGPQPFTPARRRALLDLARRRRLPLLEVEGPWELHGGARPDLPLLTEDPHGVCLLAGGFEGILAPGLALGFLAGPPGPLQAFARLAARLDLGADPLLAASLARLLDSGELARLLRRLRQAYQLRRDAAARGLAAALGPAFRVELPALGLGLWLHLPLHFHGPGWIQACRRKGLRLPEPAGDGRSLYLGFGAVDPDTFAGAAALMAGALNPSA